MQHETEHHESVPQIIELSPLEVVQLAQAEPLDWIATDDPLEWTLYLLSVDGMTLRTGHA